MRTQFPDFRAVALGRGYEKNLQVVALSGARDKNDLYLAAWQASSNGAWMIPSYNQLSAPPGRSHAFTAVALGNGDHGKLQVVGLAERKIYLAAWQDLSGNWTTSGFALGTDRDYQAVALGNGDHGHLQVVGLTTDKKIYLVAKQDSSGSWTTPGSPLGADRGYEAVALGNSSHGNLQVVGLAAKKIYLVAWQDSSGHWTPDGRALGKDREYEAVFLGNGDHGYLQVVGLTTDNKIYLVAWQDSSGNWTPDGRALGTDRDYQAVALGNSSHGYLQVVGLTRENEIYLASWQDSSGDWHTSGLALGTDRGYQAVAVGNGGCGYLQVIGLGADNKVYQVAYLDSSGEWFGGRPLTQDSDRGRWNPMRLVDVPQSFRSVPGHYSGKRKYDIPMFLNPAHHWQGMASYDNYYVLTRNDSHYGRIVVLDKGERQSVLNFTTPDEGFSHPGGCQIVGDYLGVELEKDNQSSIRFYWLAGMTDNQEPTLLPPRLLLPHASALAITDLGAADKRRYVMALMQDDGIAVYTSNGCLLDDPGLQFTMNFTEPRKNLKHGADNLCLLTDVHDGLYLIVFSGDPDGLTFKDTADLYRVDLTGRKMELIQSRHLTTSGGGPFGVHFRFGAGGQVVNPAQLEFYCCGRNSESRIDEVTVDTFDVQ